MVTPVCEPSCDAICPFYVIRIVSVVVMVVSVGVTTVVSFGVLLVPSSDSFWPQQAIIPTANAQNSVNFFIMFCTDRFLATKTMPNELQHVPISSKCLIF